MPPHPAIATTAEIVAELKAGRMVILVDEEDRENEGDLVMAAEHITPEAINFMAKHGRGLICLTLTENRCKKLGLVQMARNNKTQYGTAFTVSIEAAEGVTTGISAADRARTIQVAVAKIIDGRRHRAARPRFPDYRSRRGRSGPRRTHRGRLRSGRHGRSGTLFGDLRDHERRRHDGPPAGVDGVRQAEHLRIGTIADLIHYRAASETLVERVISKTVSTAHGDFCLHAYVDRASGATHLALVKGQIPAGGETLVRVHEPLSVLDFLDPASKQQSFSIDEAQAALAKNGHGVIVLMHRPEDGEALITRLTGTVNAIPPRIQTKWDPRTYGIGAQILRDLGVSKMRLLSSPRKMPSMTGFGLEVTGFVTSPAEL
jgi:3,4-dihydroxy 2-butanone 4-phosphate synthase/GTP cyclohydrolase II